MSENVVLDSILDSAPEGLFGDEKPEYEGPYGLGTWPNAIITEVVRHAASEKGFGYRLGLNFNLRPENEAGPMPFKGRIDLPRTLAENGHPVEDWMLKKEDGRREVLNRLLANAGSPKTVKGNIDTQEQYDALVAVFDQLVGNTCAIKVSEDGKNVREGDGWKFVANGFTKIDGIRPRGKKK